MLDVCNVCFQPVEYDKGEDAVQTDEFGMTCTNCLFDLDLTEED